MTHTDTQTPAAAMLTPAQWATEHGVKIRTVRRYLAADLLPGAYQLADRSWMIPATTPRPEWPGAAVADGFTVLPTAPTPPSTGATPGRAVTRATTPPSLPDLLNARTAYLPLADAANMLGIPAGAIRRNKAEFGAVPYGDRGALVVPAATIRRIAGLSA